MIRDVSKFAIAFLVLSLLTACNTVAPVYDVTSAPVPVTPASLADMQKAIVRAGTGLGWQMNPVAPGKVEGILLIRVHKAVVDITYDLKTYSIKYKDSINLKYDGANIHPNYNLWIQDLDKAIRTQITML